PDFLPIAPDLRFALATHLAERGKWKEAAALLVNLHRSNPQFDALGNAYLLLARVYLEGLGRSELADKVIRFLRQRFPAVLQSEEVVRLQGIAEAMRT